MDVVRLIAAGDEDSLADNFCHLGLASGVAAGNDESGDGINVAEIVDVTAVFIVAAGAQDQKVAPA